MGLGFCSHTFTSFKVSWKDHVLQLTLWHVEVVRCTACLLFKETILEPAHSLQETRADAGLTHAEKTPRGPVSGEFPPGVKCHRGVPENASPFLQALLPGTFKYEGKRSRAVSYMGSKPVVTNGTTRSEEAAQRMVLSWSWQWWDSLTTDQRSAISSEARSQPSKKRRV